MIGNVSDNALPPDVLDQIVAKTDGVPLFVEELTKTVMETGASTAETIPSTLQDSLMARLDRLSPVRELAQIGACIGREFSYELLAAVLPNRFGELGDSLQILVNSELIFRRGDNYLFKHALVQDVAYGSLLKQRRRAIHQQIAEFLESDVATAAETEPELIAHHYSAAELPARAIPYWLEAGRQATACSANAEALEHLSRGLDSLSDIPRNAERDAKELEFRVAGAIVKSCVWADHAAARSWRSPSTNLTPRMISARWFDPSSFLHFL